jgi:hypothetical protein
LLDAMRGLVPASAELLSSLGFSLSLETGESALFSRTISASDDSAQRLAGTIAAAELLAAFREGQHRDVRVSIDICCHVGSLLVAGDTVRGGESPKSKRGAAPHPAVGSSRQPRRFAISTWTRRRWQA